MADKNHSLNAATKSATLSSMGTSRFDMDIVRQVWRYLRSRYGNQFTRQFESKAHAADWGNTLAEDLAEFPEESILAGVKQACIDSPDYPPNQVKLFMAINQSERDRKRRERERLEAERIAKLPPPKTRKVDPIAELAKAKKSAFHSPEELRKLVSEHEALIRRDKALGRIREPRWTERHLCCVPGCRNLAVRCASQTGSETWYCREHVEGRV